MNPRARRENIYIEKLGDETVLYDKASHQAHCLNATVATVWEHADGTRTIDDLALVLENLLRIPRASDAALLSLEQLERSGLIEGLNSTVSTDLRSRRHVARDLAMAGISASLFPLVASVLAPTPAMAASASGPASSISSYERDLATVSTDVRKEYKAFLQSSVAQGDLSAGIKAGNRGITETLQGNNAAAQNDFRSATSDFDGVLKALGMGPL